MDKKRNQLCPCGSGKKFKHCCYSQYVQPPVGGSILVQKERERVQRKLVEQFNKIAAHQEENKSNG
jgi:hypothetical protein